MNISNPRVQWSSCLQFIRNNVTEEQYNTWFKPIVFESYSPATKTLLVKVPSPYVYEMLEEHYVDVLNKALTLHFDNKTHLSYRVLTDKTNGITQTFEGEATPDVEAQKPKTRGNQAPSILDAAPLQEIDSNLDIHRTFANFFEGDSNRLSRSIGLNIAEHPNTTQFNPMFVYGPSGCGKTHLINAIGMRTKELYPQKRVLYVSARLFQVQYTNATVQNKINDFIMFYQTIDMLIVDDIQEWMTAIKTQDTFFHIFNHLYRNGKRIILASDRSPVDLKGMNDRLLTRFASGLTAELEKPDVQLCIRILNNKIKRDGLSIPKEVVQYIAETANGSVRDLEGVINSLLAYSVVYNSRIDMRLAERVIKRAVKVDDRPLTVDEIMETVCHHYNVATASVSGKSRKREFVVPRQVSMYLAQKYTKLSAARIGKLVGSRDHSTVIHSCSQIENRMKVDKLFCEELMSIENSFKLKK